MAPPASVPPVSFNRVIEGSSIASTSSILFTIPTEILELIIGYVASDKSHLASLALVNSACRQLARSCQFKSIVLDYGSTATKVLALLSKEAAQRYRSADRVSISPSLGICVRQLMINASSYWSSVESFMPSTRHSETVVDDDELATARSVASILNEHLEHLYWPTVLLVIPTLPNLQSLTMESCELGDEVLDCLMGSSIKHLKLRGQFQRIPNVRLGRNSCPLETLSVDTSWDFHSAFDHPGQLDSSAFYQGLLELCCSSLRCLELAQRDFPGKKDRPISFDIKFPELKTLQIGWFTSVDARAVSCLVREGLSSLSIPYDDPPSELGQINTLDTLILYGNEATGSAPARLIKSNTQIRSLAIRHGRSDTFLRHAIQSLRYHENLKSLSLIWEENDIPEASLEQLSFLSQVEVIHISAGELFGWPHDWFVDHSIIGGYLSRLVNLRRLIIQRDTYLPPPGVEDIVDPMRYYHFRKPGSRRWATHEARMLDHASMYVRLLPRLEFIHIGQVLFTVKKNGEFRKPIVTGSAWVGENEYEVLKEEFEVYNVTG
ncbi:hypothetical protein F4818DRAFT_398809 [Hypoxylon cercidicola]|nr:hypothetical protein F4818DRAFT_398809 [Hypoxylon cercidicola]